MFTAKDVIFTSALCPPRWSLISALLLVFSTHLLIGADSWQARAPVPGARAAHSAVWTGRELIVWGGGVDGQFLNTGACYNPATDTWRGTNPSNAPSPRWFQAAVWTGSEMIIWGGRANFFGFNNYNDGARYNPSTDRWTPIPAEGAPSPRSQCAAVWTGSEMMIWGGATEDGIELNDGARYNPETGTWTPFSNTSGLEPRMEPTGIWTGEEFIVFGGMKFTGGQRSFGNGARYHPATDSWTPLPGANSPGSRTGHTAVWTGERMMVWGGYEAAAQVALNTGASYDPGANAWTPLPIGSTATARFYHAAVWTGSEMIVWGGQEIGGPMLNTGARYKPALQSWTGTTQAGVPEKRQFWRPDLGVWTGSGILICGGSDYPTSLDSTALYLPGGTSPPAEPGVLIQFEPPSLPHGSKLISSWSEQGFGFATGSGRMAHTDGVVSTNVPQNGGAYLQFGFGQRPLMISNLAGRTFALKRVDLAEYSTVFPVPKTITFTGYYPDGSSVVQPFTTDGAIDGGGPVRDFETFTFPSSFQGLARVEVTPDGYSLDNLLVSAGTNAPPPPPPPPASGHDVSRDFSATQNPNGVWSHGYETTLGGTFTLLTFPLTSYADNPVPVDSWSKNGYEPVAVYHNGTTNTSISDGGAGVFPPGATWFYPGVEGHADNYGVIRFTVPSGGAGTYELRTEVRAYLDGSRSGDTDFHVLKNGIELFEEFVPGNSGTSYSNRLSLVQGDTIDFAVGRGQDGIAYDSGLKIKAVIFPVTNAPPPPPPPLPPGSFDLSRDYSLAGNPNGPWTYGYLTVLSNNSFGLLSAARTFSADNGVPIGVWELNTYQLPIVAKVLGPGTAHSDGDHFTAEPGTVYFAPGMDGAPQNFGAIRFTVPAGAGGVYRLETSVRSLFDGSRSRDADFHVLKNGQQLFGQFLGPNSGTGYSNVLVLAAGDRVDFAIGRGADGLTADTGLKIQATLTLGTNAPPPPPPPPANLVFNGSFELGVSNLGNGIPVYAPNSNAISGWLVENGSVDYSGTHWPAGDGNRCLDMNGAEPGTIRQSIAGFITGASYRLSFLLAGNPELIPPLPAIKTLRASVGEFSEDYTFDASTHSVTDLGWVVRSLDFVASAPAMTLRFASLTENSGGSTLDGVSIVRLTNAPPPPPPPPSDYDAARDYSTVNNPNGPWSYGWKGTPSGGFTSLTYPYHLSAENGVPIFTWQLSPSELPSVSYVVGPGTAISAAGQFVANPGTLYFTAGADGTPYNFGAVRFTVPAGRGGNYRVETSVRDLFDGFYQGDTDFHVVRNGQELFGQFVPVHTTAGYSNVLALAEGDTIDLLVGRGQDGHQAGSGLKLLAKLTPTTNAPPPPPPPPPANLVFNGSFELGVSNLGNGIPVYAPNSNAISGWSVESGSVDYSGTHWPAGEGNRCLDMNGAGPGTIRQSIAGFITGASYRLSFLLAGNPELIPPLPAIKTLRASIGEFSEDYTFDASTHSVTDLGWVVRSLDFVASAPAMTLRFASLTENSGGPTLDGVSIVRLTNALPPPPPASFDLSRDYSLAGNPNGPWTYGYLTALSNGSFGLLTGSRTFSADNGVPIAAWELNVYQIPGVWKVMGPGVAHSDGDHFTAEPGTIYFAPGADGAPQNFGAIRFTVPAGAGGEYRLETSVRSLFDGSRSRDADFHVLKNGQQLFGQFLGPNSGTGYSNVLVLAAGDRVDFAIGRGADGLTADTGLKIQATLTPATNAPPPPPPPASFDLSRDYSLAANPNGPWTYGYLTTLSNGSFGQLGAARTFGADDGVPIGVWELNTYQLPVVAKVLGPGTAHSDGDHFTAEPGTVYFAPGADGAPQNFGAIRFTVPAGVGGQYRLETSVRSLFDGSRSRDADFHVLKNGQQVFGQFLEPNSGTGYSNVMALADGDIVDFVIGRGADGITADTGLKIGASLVRLAVPPPSPNCAAAPLGAVAWWPAEGNPNDVVGTNRGTLFGETSYVAGKVGRAFSFPGGDSGVKISASPSLDVGAGGGLTIEGWINPATLSVRGPLVEWNRGGTNAMGWGAHLYILHPEEFGLGAGNLVANLTESDGTWHFLMAPGGTIRTNTWQHVAMTYDKASGEGRLYRNGEVVASGNLGTFTPETSYDLYLGRRPAGEGMLSYRGLLDEIAIYGRALSADEVAGIARAGGSGKCRVPAELEQLVVRVSELPSPIETPLLLSSLEAVRDSIARGNLFSAIQQLQAFQTQVFLGVGPVDLALAEELAELAQQIIEALDPTGVRRVTFVAAAEAPLRLNRCVLTPTGATCVEGRGAPGATCCVQRSTNLVNWESIGCATEIDDGEFEFIDTNPPAGAARFYRLYSP